MTLLGKISEKTLNSVRKVSSLVMLGSIGFIFYNSCQVANQYDSSSYQQAIKLEEKMGKLEKKLAQECVPTSTTAKISYGCIDLKEEYDELTDEYKKIKPAYEKVKQDIIQSSDNFSNGMLGLFIAFPFWYVSSAELRARKISKFLEENKIIKRE